MLKHLLMLLFGLWAGVVVAEAPAFDQFPAELDTAPRVDAPDLASHADAPTFAACLNLALAEGDRFGGRFAFAEWGCGSSCQMAAIIDRATGAVHFAPVASLGYAYRVDSNLLILNPPENIGEPMPSDPICQDESARWATTSHYYAWDGSAFVHLTDVDACDCPTCSFEPL